MSSHGEERSRLVELGRIVNAHGIRGEVRMLPYNPATETARRGLEVVLRRGEESKRLVVSGARRHKSFVLLTFEGVRTRDEAEALVGFSVEVDAEDLPPKGLDELYHFELVGLRVFTREGRFLGRVSRLLPTPAHDVCVVEGAGAEVLLPFVRPVVLEVDPGAGRMVVDPPPGLLDDLP
ncbi:MAG: ribosome maturation factor RimM [Candidatus Binatia bacterium]|nr:MAG: ribosome maturation factor RimM [Candidatus Binatia bacterium]